MSFPALDDLIAAHGGVAFSLGLDRPGAAHTDGGSVIRPLRRGSAELRSAPVRLTLSSSDVRRGDLFAALRGLRADGLQYVPDALARGASAVLVPADRPLLGLRERCVAALGRSGGLPESAGPGVAWVHPAPRRTAGRAASTLAGDPSGTLRLAAVTGTNGKTSVCHLTHGLLVRSSIAAGLLGTSGHRILGPRGPLSLGATHTTPDAPALQDLFGRHRAGGGTSLVFEASSHALDQERLAGTQLAAAGFTNLSRDHLDYHGTLRRYLAAKARLWDHLVPGGVAVVHGSDAASDEMAARAAAVGARVVRARVDADADLVAADLARTEDGTSFRLEGLGGGARRVAIPLAGRFNVENTLVAIGLARALGATDDAIAQALEVLTPPPGRLERVLGRSGGPDVYVDYAHTPDALVRALGTLREELDARGAARFGAAASRSARGRILCVFGCGGDRDRGKRFPMGEAAGRLADVSIVTSDNPRSEDPGDIAHEVVLGVDAVGGRRLVETDRRRAIERALDLARPGDVVLVAGKGHENTQVGPQGAVPFDDRVVAVEALRGRATARRGATR
ncbi:MAG: UDP-N-acetylmuramoyl-L-alanyl-D-glutamate--2,6-diaminopimelate ligase [Planctomycetota bacterium]